VSFLLQGTKSRSAWLTGPDEETTMAANAMSFVFGIVAPLAGVGWLLTLH
jgi:hypothetical protein